MYIQRQLEVVDTRGNVTRYNVEFSGPDGKPIECIVVSESPHNTGPVARACEQAIGEQIAEQTGKTLKDMSMLIEQAEGKYLYRTFREYDTGHQTKVLVNNHDREGRLFTRQEADKYLSNAEIPHENRLSPDNLADDARKYNLAQESFSGKYRPPNIEHER